MKPRIWLQVFPHPTLAARVAKWVCGLGYRFGIGDTPEEAYRRFIEGHCLNELLHG